MQKVLVIGYGNLDREDDGVAWHILEKLSQHYDNSISVLDAEIDRPINNPHLVLTLQLTPEMSEPLAQYDFVCFVDAHTGAYEEEVRVITVKPGYQTSSFTHHLTPESCLELARTLFGHAPEALIVSVRGYHFGYRTELSDQTASLVPTAVKHIIDWITSAITSASNT